MKKPKVRIHQNIWGNWNGYIGTRKVAEFGTDKHRANQWYLDHVAPKQSYGEKVHPVTKEIAPEGFMWCANAINGNWFLENERTPYTFSAASETYWCT